MSDQRDFTTARYWVRTVHEVPTRNAGPTRYELVLFSADAHVPHTMVTTLDQWKAALCQRAAVSPTPSLITWRHTKFGHELVSIQLNDVRPLIERLIPHDGDFGTSGWVLCQAPTCVVSVQGIPRGEANFVDPQTNQHWHTACVEAARAENLERRRSALSVRGTDVSSSAHDVDITTPVAVPIHHGD